MNFDLNIYDLRNFDLRKFEFKFPKLIVHKIKVPQVIVPKVIVSQVEVLEVIVPEVVVGQAVLGYNFGKNPKYRRSVHKRCVEENKKHYGVCSWGAYRMTIHREWNKTRNKAKRRIKKNKEGKNEGWKLENLKMEGRAKKHADKIAEERSWTSNEMEFTCIVMRVFGDPSRVLSPILYV